MFMFDDGFGVELNSWKDYLTPISHYLLWVGMGIFPVSSFCRFSFIWGAFEQFVYSKLGIVEMS